MRAVVLTLLAILLLSLPALARAKREVRTHPASSGRNHVTPGTEFINDLRGYGWTGRPVYGDAWSGRRRGHQRDDYNCFYGSQRLNRQRPGLSIRYNDGNWSGELNTGYSNAYPPYSRANYRFNDCYVAGDGYLLDSYSVGGRPVYVFGAPTAFDNGVITPRRNYGQIYTAPSNSDYGYVGGQYASDYSYPGDNSYDYNDSTTPQVYNDNRVYNYYYGDEAPASQQQQPAAIQPRSKPAPLEPSPVQHAAFGQRFQKSLKLETPDGAYYFAIRDGALYAGLASGKATRLTDKVDADFGGYAAWLPGTGACVFYRVGSQFCLGRPSEDARWMHEPLPYTVHFGPDTSIGMVGGTPWLTFSATDSKRYVVRYTGSGWEEVGSGSR